jgi:hypothetical protein
MTPSPAPKDQEAWNEAYDRLVAYLNSFALADHAHTSTLALDLLREAREEHAHDPSQHPTQQTIGLAQRRLVRWLATNLNPENKSPSHVIATGCIALLLSRSYRTAPTYFLSDQLPEDLRESLRQPLISTGPDLNVSSMTPRHLDYGPMLQFAKQTWHRWQAKEIILAVIFWSCVYVVLYWWLSHVL